MIVCVKGVVKLHNVAMVGQVLQDLHVFGDFLLVLTLLIHQVTLPEALNGDKVSTELVLGNTNFSEGTFSKFVANSVEL